MAKNKKNIGELADEIPRFTGITVGPDRELIAITEQGDVWVMRPIFPNQWQRVASFAEDEKL